MLVQLVFDGLDVVLLADEPSADDPVSVAGYQPTMARDAGEARDVIDRTVLLCLHDELVRWNGLAAGATSSGQAEHTAHRRKRPSNHKLTITTESKITNMQKQQKLPSECTKSM